MYTGADPEFGKRGGHLSEKTVEDQKNLLKTS